jgi:hypothetical protein
MSRSAITEPIDIQGAPSRPRPRRAIVTTLVITTLWLPIHFFAALVMALRNFDADDRVSAPSEPQLIAVCSILAGLATAALAGDHRAPQCSDLPRI